MKFKVNERSNISICQKLNALDNIVVSSKTDRQELSIAKWLQAGGRGVLDIVPRFGKTRIGLKVAHRALLKEPTRIVRIVVPNVQVKAQWEFNISVYKEHNPDFNTHNVHVLTRLQFLTLPEKLDMRIVIYDEVHKYLTDITFDAIIKRNVKHVLCLTGTVPIDSEQLSRLLQIAPIVDEIKEDEALRNDWINKYEEYNYAIEFDNYSKLDYIKYSKKIGEVLDLFRGSAKRINSVDIYNDINFAFKSDYAVITACLSGAFDITSRKYIGAKEVRDIIGKVHGWSRELNLHNAYDNQIDNYWSPDRIIVNSQVFTDFVRLRNELICSSKNKLQAVIKIVQENPDIETLIYVGSINAAEQLKMLLDFTLKTDKTFVYHSKVESKAIIDINTGDYFRYKTGARIGEPKLFGKSKLKEFAINGMSDGRCKIIITVESLNEGLDIPSLKRVIIASGSTNTISHKQRSARVKTIDPNDIAKVGKVINVFYDNFTHNGEYIISRDRSKLLKRQSDSENVPKLVRFNI